MNKDLGLIGKYELQRPLERGSLTEVWKAFDTRLKRSVVLKLLHPDLQVNPDFITRFEREVPVISSLGHPNIVQILDYQVFRPGGSDNLQVYIVMNYVQGRTLAYYIRNTSRAGQFPSAADIVHLFTPICDAIDYAHQRGVIHAGLKPSNILLDNQYLLLNPMGEPKVTDFGIAKMLATSTGKLKSQPGTLRYNAPEQTLDHSPGDKLSDIYSLGVILYEICTGRLPFEGESNSDTVMQLTSSIPPSPALINPSISQAVSDVVLRSLAKGPADRFASASAMMRALGDALNLPIPEHLSWFPSLPDHDGTSPALHLPSRSEHAVLDTFTTSPGGQKEPWSPSAKWWSPRKSQQPIAEEPAPVPPSEPPSVVQSKTSQQPAAEGAAPALAPESLSAAPSGQSQQSVVEEPAPVLALESPVAPSSESQQPAVEKTTPVAWLPRVHRFWKPGSFQSVVRKQAAEKPVPVLQKHRPRAAVSIAGKVHNVPMAVDPKGEDKQRIPGKRQKARRPYLVICALCLVLLCTA